MFTRLRLLLVPTILLALAVAACGLLPASPTATLPPPSFADATQAMAEAAATENVMAEAMPETGGGPNLLLRGEFYAIEHEGEGTVEIFEAADGSRFLRLEDDFHVLNGPDLHVYLVPDDPVPPGFGYLFSSFLDLGSLKGNSGSQNYDIVPGTDLGPFKSVVIWCQPFRVPFAGASLRAP